MDYRTTQRYWAAEEPAALAASIMEKWRTWRRYHRQTGFARKAINGHLYFHGWDRLMDSAAALALRGDKRTYLRTVINEVRVLVQRNLAQLTDRVPVMDPVAANGDSAARQQAMVAKGVLEHFHREERVDSLHAEVRKLAYIMGEAFRLCEWDAGTGEVTAAEKDDDGKLRPTAYAGAFKNTVLSPFDVAKDTTLRSWRHARWCIARTYENKWELAARYPEKASEIISLGKDIDPEAWGEEVLGVLAVNHSSLVTGDYIPAYHFFHLDGPELQGGRSFTVLSPGVWLASPEPLPYDSLPVKRLAPDTPHGTTLGDTNVFDALGIADSLNILWSTWLTNNARWGIGALAMAKGSGISHEWLGNGSSALEYTPVPTATNGGIPTPITPPASPPESFEVAGRLSGAMMRTVGQNETSMGQLPFAGMPASLVAQLIEQSSQFQNAFASGITEFESECATHELKTLKRFATDPRVYRVIGASKRWMMKKFTGADLEGVDHIAMEPVPALAKSVAGKQMQLDAMVQMGVQLNPMDIVNFFKTGEIDSVLAEEQSTRLRQAAENELLREAQYLKGPDGQPQPMMDPLTGLPVLTPDGKPVFEVDPKFLPPVIIGRPQWLDIPRHLSILGEEMENPAVTDAVLQTVKAKFQAWLNTPPELLALLGSPPIPGMQPMGPDGAPLPPEEDPTGDGSAPPAPTPEVME